MILVLDGNELLMRSIFIWRRQKRVPITYFLLLQLFKYIKDVPSTKIYLVADGGGSWRKTIYPEYKANRKGFRDSFSDIDWDKIFGDYNKLLANLQSFSPIKVVKIENIEGDDVMSYVARYSEGDVTIVSQDKDMQQLLVLPNVYVFSPRKQEYITRDSSILDIVPEKIRKGDKGDNIPGANNLPEQIRNQVLIDLINLPTTVDAKIREYLSTIVKDEKNYVMLGTMYPYKALYKGYEFLQTLKEDK